MVSAHFSSTCPKTAPKDQCGPYPKMTQKFVKCYLFLEVLANTVVVITVQYISNQQVYLKLNNVTCQLYLKKLSGKNGHFTEIVYNKGSCMSWDSKRPCIHVGKPHYLNAMLIK